MELKVNNEVVNVAMTKKLQSEVLEDCIDNMSKEDMRDMLIYLTTRSTTVKKEMFEYLNNTKILNNALVYNSLIEE